MGDDPRRLALAGQAVAGLPAEVAEQHVDLEVLVERLPLEERGLERVAQRADGIGEHVVEHPAATLLVAARRCLACVLVLTDVADGVATLTLNNPDERNTLTAPMVAEIVAAMDAIEADESIGAVVVTGTPPAFCAGANLGNLRRGRRREPRQRSTRASCASPAARCRRSPR